MRWMGPSVNQMGSNLQILEFSGAGLGLGVVAICHLFSPWFLGSAGLLTAAPAQIRRLGRVWLYASFEWEVGVEVGVGARGGGGGGGAAEKRICCPLSTALSLSWLGSIV